MRQTSRIYRVEQVNGPWLWLKAEEEGASGWTRAAEVIRYDQAIDYFTNQIRANPANYSAYMRRGHIWRDKKEYDPALADYTEAIRLDPGSEIAYNNHGLAWHAKSEYEKAIADYGEAIRLDPKYVHAYFNRAVLDLMTGRDGATAGMRRVLELEKGKGELSSYAVILGHLAARRAGDEKAAREFLGPLARTSTRRIGSIRSSGSSAVSGTRPSSQPWPSIPTRQPRPAASLASTTTWEGRESEARAHYRWVKEHGKKN